MFVTKWPFVMLAALFAWGIYLGLTSWGFLGLFAVALGVVLVSNRAHAQYGDYDPAVRRYQDRRGRR
jgi:hypothetical protein